MSTSQVRTGDVDGQVVVGDFNCVINAAEGSTVSVRQGGPPPVTRRGKPEGHPLPRAGATLLGRDAELARVTGWLAEDLPVEIHGAPGAGRSALLRKLATDHLATGEQVVYLSAAGLPVEDLLQELFQACYEAADYQPKPARLRQLMGKVRALFLIDDFAGSTANLDRLLDATPGGDVVIVTGHPLLGSRGRSLELKGLAEGPAMALIEAELGRAPAEGAEREAALELCRAASGHPRALRQAVDASRGTATFDPDPAAVTQALIAGLDSDSRTALLIMSTLGDAPLSATMLDVLTGAGAGSGARALSGLVEAQVAEAAGRGYRLAVRPGTDTLDEAPAHLRRLADWARTAPANEVARSAAAVTRLLATAVELGEHAIARDLARAAAPALARALRWGSWRTVLALGLAAAQALGSANDIAYFTHEEKVRGRALGLVAGGVVGGAAGAGLLAALGGRSVGGAVSAHPIAVGAATAAAVAVAIAGVGIAAAQGEDPPPRTAPSHPRVYVPPPRPEPSKPGTPRPDVWLGLSASSVRIGDSYRARAGGMEPGEPVTFSWTGKSSGGIGTHAASRSGEAETVVREGAAPGDYTIWAKGRNSGRTASAPLRVLPAKSVGTPRLVLNPSRIKVGETTTATASGFDPGESVKFVLGPAGHSGSYALEEVNDSGVAVARGMGLGWATPGNGYTVHAQGTKSGRTARARLEYAQEPSEPPETTAAPNPARQGMTITVRGTGFRPGESVVLQCFLFPARSRTAASDGSVEFTERIPDNAATGNVVVRLYQVRTGRSDSDDLTVEPKEATP